MDWWKTIAIYLIIAAVLRAIVRAVKDTNRDFDAKNKESEYEKLAKEAWGLPALPRPAILPGERTEQGALKDSSQPDRMIYHWDRTKVYQWLDAQIAKIHPTVTNKKILQYYDTLMANPKEKPANYDELCDWMFALPRDEWGEFSPENTSAYQLFCLINARHNIGAYGYSIAFFRLGHEGKEGWDIPHDICIALNRLAADKDFNPAAVNMWAYIHENQLELEPYVDLAVQEVYLRHFFELGASDGHYHIATQLLDFYVESPYPRKDDGFVAAAMERVRRYDEGAFHHYLYEIKNRKLNFDLKDKSISRNGFLYEMAAVQRSAVN